MVEEPATPDEEAVPDADTLAGELDRIDPPVT